MKLADKVEIIRYNNGEYTRLHDLMVHEVPIILNIIDVEKKELYCSPNELFELVLGHLYCQKYINRIADVEYIDLDPDAGIANIKLKEADSNTIVDFEKNSCEAISFNIDMLFENQGRFYDESTLQKATGGVHRCALCDDTGTLMACIDVSRHNALDKVIGKALLNGLDFSDKYLITSGRVPLDMITKASAINLPMLVSRSTPTIAAVKYAKEYGITLLGFSRDNRFNVYSGARRLGINENL